MILCGALYSVVHCAKTIKAVLALEKIWHCCRGDPPLYERRSPFNPSEVVAEIVALMRQYRCSKIVGDKYGAQWTVEAFARAGARYEPSELDRSAIYMNCLPIFTSGRARLLDNQKMVSQFAASERRTFSTGRERVDPGPGHDDLCNSAAIALSLADNKRGPIVIPDELMQWASIPRRRLGGEPWGPPARSFF
jgi:hypothetical protein